MDVPLNQIDVDSIERILQAWMAVGGRKPSIQAQEIAMHIEWATRGRVSSILADGFRFGSNVGDSKLRFAVKKDTVTIGINPNGPPLSPEWDEKGRAMQAAFEQQLKGIFGDRSEQNESVSR